MSTTTHPMTPESDTVATGAARPRQAADGQSDSTPRGRKRSTPDDTRVHPWAEGTGTMQLVSFRLAREEYGVEITKVQEIIMMGEITRVPQTPDYVKGVINLRSSVIPVVDLRRRFGLASESATDLQRIMVVNISGKTIGLIVDSVSEVLRISHDQIAPPPPTVAGLGQEYLTGLARLENRLLILLDLDKILDPEEAAAMDAATAGS